MKKNISVLLILGVAVSVIALFLAFRNVPFSDLVLYMASINLIWAVPSVLTGLIAYLVRVSRWQMILGPSHRVGFWQAFHPLMIGFMMNCIVPGRIGELARPAILKKNMNVPFSTGLATVIVERVFDVIILILLFAGLSAVVEIDPDLDITFNQYHLNRETLIAIGNGMIKLFLLLIAGILMLSIPRTRKMIQQIIQNAPSLLFFVGKAAKEKLEKRVCNPLLRFIENFAHGLSLLKYPARILACFGLSVVIWCLMACSFYIIAQGCPGITVSFIELYAVLVITCFFIALPSVPGFWGVWEAGGVFALALFGVSAKDAAGFTLANHAIQMIPIIIVGLVSAMITGVDIWQVSYGEDRFHDNTRDIDISG
ncbi:lysylphosphatidylglycerol synthase transmembrane domain-containing protein [Thermodesulfobacteriota bacterium]